MKITEPEGRPHRNHGLFSDHYLNVTLPGRQGWRALVGEAEGVMAEVSRVLDSYAPSRNEAQTEEDLVRPVLRALGHEGTYEVQPALATPEGTRRPDYVFYRDAASRDANKDRTLTDDLLAGSSFAVGDAKFWERPLDASLKIGSRDAFSNRNPSYQISFYMQHSGTEWGVLTNGRLWRLYHKDTAHKLDRFYEVDLPALVENEDLDDFLYFYAFFRRAAFEDGSLGVGALLAESADYARSVGDSLKVQVYEALRHLAQGFLDHPKNGLGTDPGTLREVYDNSLIVLYRLLFVLYAESRDLLPVRGSQMYRETYSLYAIKREVAAGRRLLPTSATLWPKLLELFGIIDGGSEPLSVATFNGGLFDPDRHPFLERHAVGDGHLQRAVDRLARVEGQFVDYRDLAERHLGTIYEGLLEFHLEALAEPEEGWTIALLDDNGERRATGSYYTPDFVVKYIVGATVDPVLREAVAGAKTDREKVEAVLALDVLDPSMGSGHFLVEVTERIARFLVELGVAPEEAEVDGEAELAYWKRRVVQSCVYGVDLNPLAVDLAKLSLWLATVARDRPLSFLDHHLRTGNSLVGANISDLQPVGKERKKAKAKADENQLSMLEDDAFRRSLSTAVGSLWLIEESPADTVEDVRKQERLYVRLRENLNRRHARLADLATATSFGVQVDPSLWRPLADYITKGGIAAPSQFDAWLEASEEVARRRRFFHWELEFPEVFFDRQGRPLGDDAGFDAIVGNPPYIRRERLTPFKPYLRESFDSYHSAADLYLYFYEQGVRLLRESGRMSYISSGTFARANFASGFRKLFPTMARIESVIDFGENQPFEGAEMVRPSIVVLEKDKQDARFRSLFISGKVPESLQLALSEEGVDSDPAALQQREWIFQPVEVTRLFEKIRDAGTPLSDVVDRRMYRGILTGLNEAFIVDQAIRDRLTEADPSCEPLIKRSLRGEDLRPWYQEDEGRWMIVLPSGWTRSEFGAGLSEEEAWEQFRTRHPVLSEYLRPFADAARKRADKGEYWWELRSCDYYDEFEKPKLFWPDIAKLPRFSRDDEGKFINNKGYIIPVEDPVLLGILQSRVLWFAVSQIFQPLRLRAGLWQYQMFTQFTSRLPIPDASDEERKAIGALAMEITEAARTRYALHERTRRRVLSDLGAPSKKLNQKLTAWWNLDFPVFRAEIKKVFKQDVPLAERDEWEDWLAGRRGEHERLTAEIVRLETELNDRVYGLFELTPQEIQIVEESTKYRYGEV